MLLSTSSSAGDALFVDAVSIEFSFYDPVYYPIWSNIINSRLVPSTGLLAVQSTRRQKRWLYGASGNNNHWTCTYSMSHSLHQRTVSWPTMMIYTVFSSLFFSHSLSWSSSILWNWSGEWIRIGQGCHCWLDYVFIRKLAREKERSNQLHWWRWSFLTSLLYFMRFSFLSYLSQCL